MFGIFRRRQRVLEPIERLSEVLFGLIMVLTFTCSISASHGGEEEVGTVLIGALGCNLAWGIIDAVMYLMASLIERGQPLTLARAVHASKDAVQARKVVADALPEPFDTLLDGEALDRAVEHLSAAPAGERPRFTQQDWLGALAVFLLVFLSTFPVVVPFLVFADPYTAMRVSNGIAIAMLFGCGHMFGRSAGLSPVRTGLAMVAIGVVLVAITIALGG